MDKDGKKGAISRPNSPNQIKVLREPHMKYNVTQLDGKNEPVNFVLVNYFIELEPGNYKAEEASSTPDTQPNLLRFLRADEIDCKIVIRGNLGSKMGLIRKCANNKFCELEFKNQ